MVLKVNRLLVLGLLGLFLTAGSWRDNGKVVPDTSWAKSDGDFGAQLVFTDKPDDLFEAWSKPGPAVMYSQSSSAVRGGPPIVGVIFFAGCGQNEHGNCNATVKFKILGPDKKPWGTNQDGELWVDKPSPPENSMQLSMGNIGIIIEPEDQLGTYRVIAEISDKVSGKRMVLERDFEAVAGK